MQFYKKEHVPPADGPKHPMHGKMGGKMKPMLLLPLDEVEGWSREEFENSECGKNIAENRRFLELYENELDPGVIRYWADMGIRKEVFDADVKEGVGKYSVFTPMDLDMNKKYALLYYSHAGMDTIYSAESFGFTKLAATEKLIIVYANNGGPSNDEVVTEFPRIIGEIQKKGYPVDMSRIYAGGYSSGSDATESVATCWPEMVAACAPCPGSNAIRNSLVYRGEEVYEKNINLRMPLICITGTVDFGDKFPFPDERAFENFNIWMKVIAKVKDYRAMNMEESVKLTLDSPDETKRIFGLDFHKTYTEYLEGRKWYFGDYYGADGSVVARFVSGEGVPHRPTGYHAAMVWDFLKHFSRNPDTGESIYTPVVINGMS